MPTNTLQLDSTLPQVLIFFLHAGDAFGTCARYISDDILYSSSCYYIGPDLFKCHRYAVKLFSIDLFCLLKCRKCCVGFWTDDGYCWTRSLMWLFLPLWHSLFPFEWDSICFSFHSSSVSPCPLSLLFILVLFSFFLKLILFSLSLSSRPLPLTTSHLLIISVFSAHQL